MKGRVRTGWFDGNIVLRIGAGGAQRGDSGERVIHTVLYSVIMAALLFICVPPS